MTYDLSNEYEVRRVLLRLNTLIKKGVLVELKEQRPLRTLSQNSYLHLLLQVFAMEYGCSLDVAKVDYYKRLCNQDLFEVEKVNKQGEVVKDLRSSADLTTEEMAQSIDRFKRFAAEGGIYLPDADRLHDLQCAKIAIERYDFK
jgi:hypothetical protein